MHKAEGWPTIKEEEEAEKAWFREQMEAGVRFDPDFEGWTRRE
jgi:hypothetical protein